VGALSRRDSGTVTATVTAQAPSNRLTRWWPGPTLPAVPCPDPSTELLLGLTTYIRLVAVNHDETRWVLGMNRIRAAYQELAPELERWFITSHHDDKQGAMATGGWGTFPTLFGYVTTPAAVGITVAVVAGVIVVLGTPTRWASEPRSRPGWGC
jgi:hypothetical protein